MALNTVNAEFLGFTCVHAMSCLKLQSCDLGEQRHNEESVIPAGDANVVDKINVLATSLKLDPGDLSSEMDKIKAIALAIKLSSAVNDQDAWRSAILKCEASKSKAKYPTANIKAVVLRWFAWNISTSDIERAFSLFQAAFSNARRGRMSRQREQDIITMCYDYNPAEADQVIALAQELWKVFYNDVAEVQYRKRLDAGVSKGKRLRGNFDRTSICKATSRAGCSCSHGINNKSHVGTRLARSNC